MIRAAIRAAILAALAAFPAAAQEGLMVESPAAILRWLDKITGETADIELARGQSAVSGQLTIQMNECRYPAENPSSNAYVHLTVMDARQATPVFSGWMVAASPALSALDHPRYDVWPLRCVLPAEAAPAPPAGDGATE